MERRTRRRRSRRTTAKPEQSVLSDTKRRERRPLSSGFKRFLFFIGIVLATNVITFLVARQTNQGMDLPGVNLKDQAYVAKINGQEISYDEWLSYLQDRYGKKGLSSLITERVATELASEQGIKVNERLVDFEVAYLHTISGQMTEDVVLNEEKLWRKEIAARHLTDHLLTHDIEVEEEAMVSYYDTYQGDFINSGWYELSVISVDDQDEAGDVYQALLEGADFHSLALDYKDSDRNEEKNGYLGYYSQDTTLLASSWLEVINGLDPYTHSEPFESDNLYHVLYVSRKIEPLSLSYDDVRDYIKTKLALESLSETPKDTTLWDRVEFEWIY